MIDPMRVYPDELRELLSGEAPRAAALCQRAFGADRLERTPEELTRTLSWLPESLRKQAEHALAAGPADHNRWERVVDALTSGMDLPVDPEAAIGGVAASGHVNSYAARLSGAISGQRSVYCVVGNGRLVLARQQLDTSRHDEKGLHPTTFTELASVPLAAVIAARRDGRFLQRGRVVLDFVDLSSLALMTGALFTGAARRLVSALTPGLA